MVNSVDGRQQLSEANDLVHMNPPKPNHKLPYVVLNASIITQHRPECETMS